ncbi:MAG: type II toxin-antitoxin system Phd/YefM family antitoxin [Gammaproteobacteria bacterium]|nr:type II toxin-antitoxin system Phd/YefM family antitoxin [Gammaproteobacteria bacterium]
MTTLTSREFNQKPSEAKRAAASGPVIITDRGRPAHVLLGIEAYRKLSKQRRNLLDAVSMEGLSEINFDPGRFRLP